jgi:hypothetical protein
MLRSGDRLLNGAAETALGTFGAYSGNGPNDAAMGAYAGLLVAGNLLARRREHLCHLYFS